MFIKSMPAELGDLVRNGQHEIVDCCIGGVTVQMDQHCFIYNPVVLNESPRRLAMDSPVDEFVDVVFHAVPLDIWVPAAILRTLVNAVLVDVPAARVDQ